MFGVVALLVGALAAAVGGFAATALFDAPTDDHDWVLLVYSIAAVGSGAALVAFALRLLLPNRRSAWREAAVVMLVVASVFPYAAATHTEAASLLNVLAFAIAIGSFALAPRWRAREKLRRGSEPRPGVGEPDHSGERDL